MAAGGTQVIYTSLVDAGFTILQKQPRIHGQEENLVNRKAFASYGHEVNCHFQIIVAYTSNEGKKQYTDNTSWMIKSKMKNNASIFLNIPGVPHNQKVTIDGAVVRLQQMSLQEAIEIVNRFREPGPHAWICAVEPAERHSITPLACGCGG